jgi:hypothetical protein
MSAKISEEITRAPVQSSSPGKDIENPRGEDDSQEQEAREEPARKLEAQATSLGVLVQSFAIAGAFHI